MFQINCYRASAWTNNAGGGNVSSVHWNTAVNFSGDPGTSYFRIDGDTPIGTEMIVYSSMVNATYDTGKYHGYNTFFTWANAGYNYGSLSETHSYGTMASAVGSRTENTAGVRPAVFVLFLFVDNIQNFGYSVKVFP